MKKNSISFSSQIAGTIVFAVLMTAAVVFFVSVFGAGKYKAPVVLDRSYDRSEMLSAVSPESVQAKYNEILALGSRAPGQAGLEAAADLIRKEYKDAGLEIFEQEVMIPYSLTDGGKGTLTFSDKSTLDVLPFFPNYVQPVVTPEEGLNGKLFLVSEESVRRETKFTDKIAVVDMAQPLFKELGLTPSQYIELGFQAVIFTHAEGLEKIPWNNMGNIYDPTMPANLVRLAAAPEILNHIGEEANVRSISRWVNARTTNIIGVLRAPEGKSQGALVIPVTYDAASLLPDYAQGPVQALQSAIQLQMLKGLLPHRENLRRDVVFASLTGVSQGLFGSSRLLASIGEYGKSASTRERLDADLAENEALIKQLSEIKALFDDKSFAVASAETSATSTEEAIKKLPADTRKFLAGRVGAVTRKAVFDQAEVLLKAEIDYKRNPDDLKSPEFQNFRTQKKLYDDLNNLSALPLPRALERPIAVSKVFQLQDGTPAFLRDALLSHIDYLLEYHKDRAKALEQDKALFNLFNGFQSIVCLSPHLQPTLKEVEHETLGFAVGKFNESNANSGEAASLFNALVNDSVYALGLERDVTVKDKPGMWPYNALLGGVSFDSNPWGVISIPAFSTCAANNSSPNFRHPFSTPEFTNLVSIANSLKVTGEVATGLARGYGNFPRLPFVSTYSIRGNVYASGIGNSVVPNYAVSGALVASLDEKPYIFTDPYGNYRHPFLTMPSVVWPRKRPIEAFYFGKNGIIEYVKDNGATAQNIYASKIVPSTDVPVNLILYRAAPVAVLNIVNPQSMKAYTGISFLSRSGLAEFPSTSPYSGQGKMDFIPPKEYFFLTLKAGAPGNELVATTRAFCLGTLNTNSPAFKPSDNEIDGAGYLAYDTPVFRNITLESAASMEWLAGKRLELQERYGMADKMTLDLDRDAGNIIEEDASSVDTPSLSRLRRLRQSLSYLILNHPVIRNSVSEAVWGILWYMGLLVPFIFFFEKLIFGYTDIRKQILAQGVTFFIVFLLLRILHPAFHMTRSSVMILLGFVIMLIVGSVTIVLFGKFQENLDELRKAQGGVKGTSGNKFGIVMTAFMLGLNNMHKRKVRTGLTCATLVLMTFVMICFTSVQSNIVEKERAIGHAPYQGILIREKQFRPIADAEIAALNATYGEKHTVNVRYSYTGTINMGTGQPSLANFEISRGKGEQAVKTVVKCGLSFTHTEPLGKKITLLTTNGWFTAEQSLLTQAPYPLIISSDAADALGVQVADVNEGPVPVTMSGREYYIWGIFDPVALASVKDVDGENLLPFDVEAITNPQIAEQYILAEQSDPRVQPTDVIIALNGQISLENTVSFRASSAVVDMGTSPLPVAREEINSYLVQTGRDTNYGLDGTAFNGRRARERSMAGLADLLIPLIIAALTVLNTMKGSVYERHDEIFVYNAVGIAPRYIFFMFVAEALVYSVVGAVLGYILSQGTGRILTALDWTGGMNMNFTSITTIYASLAIAAATLASTYFPAKSAMEIAKPADNAGWTMPKPDADDRIVFMLPFTFTHYDRIAVLAFFYQYFENHGEGSAGPFFSAVPELKLADHTDELADGAYIPSLEVQVWLKPFDLGVSQKITIELGTDPDTKEYISKMILERITGTRDAWLRLNTPLVALIRQHFLHWRAVPDDSKRELFAKAKALLEESIQA